MSGMRSVPYGVVHPYDGGDVPEYRRYRAPGGTYFFTVNWLERRLDTLVRHIDLLREAVRVTKRERPFHIDAWEVLPDHMHCMWTLPPGDDDFSNRWKERISWLCDDSAPIAPTISTVESGFCNWVGYAVRTSNHLG